MFVHSMTLQQITYMGVMESVALKQKNFPFRKKFEEFYAEYELLSPRYAQKRYYQMEDKSSEDFVKYSSDIVTENMQGQGAEYYAIGTTKVLMMPEAKAVIEECMKKASAEKDAKATILKRAYCLLMAPEKIAKKLRACRMIQCMYRLKIMKHKKKKAEEFRIGFEKAITEFKAEKRKTFEVKAGAAIEEVIIKHIFRNKLAKAIKAR